MLDWHSRCVSSWQLSDTLDVSFCLQDLHAALRWATDRAFIERTVKWERIYFNPAADSHHLH